MRSFLSLIFVLLFSCQANAIVVGHSLQVAGGTTTECIGYSTNCAFSTDTASEITQSADQVDANRWTATLSATVTRIKFNCGSFTSGTSVILGYWNGTQLRGTTADIQATCTANSETWQWFEVSSYSGRSLAFSSSDVIRYGVASDDPSGNLVAVSYEAGETLDGYDRDTSAYLQDPATWSALDNNAQGWAIILEYEY